jgi:thiosulfate/3-mercaptopyruvate sulfurtransferase
MKYATIVSTGALAERLGDPDWIVFDCRHDLLKPDAGAIAYAKSHIAGARFLRLDQDLAGPKTGRNGRHPLPDPQAFAATLGAAGVDAGKQVVAYDAQEGVNASRLWWMLRWVGHEAVAVLDGGWQKWLADERHCSADVPQPAPAHFHARPREGWVDVQYVQSHLGHEDMLVLDARSPARFRGEAEPIDPVAGRIPGSANRFYRDNLDAQGLFKTTTQLSAEFTSLLGSRAPGQIVHSCGSGVSTCHNLLAMEIAGLSGGRLYPGSWSEWCADPARPIAKG